MEEIIKFFKHLFGDDFELKGLSSEEGKILDIDKISDNEIESFFTNYLNKNTIWYDITYNVLYSYQPKNDWFFMKAVTNAWAFKYIFYPMFLDEWDGWYSDYKFKIYEKEFESRYKFKKTVKYE